MPAALHAGALLADDPLLQQLRPAIVCHAFAGNCASLRMDNLLNSDALTMFVLESLPLWYFPLLVGPV